MATDIFQLIDTGENAEIEFKEAGQGLPRDLWETYSSFANTNGGFIVLGVKQNANTFQISGVDVLKRLKEFWDTINNPQKVSHNLLNNSDVQVISADGKKVIKIFVPRASRKQKPIYVGVNGQRRGMKYFLSEVFYRHLENNEGNSVNNEGNSVNSEDDSVNNVLSSVNSDDEVMQRLLDISKVAREKRRININEMKNIILKLCEVSPLMLKELAELLDRNEDGIRNNYLSILKEEGKIKLRYPGQINHPQQAYITVTENE